MQFFLYSLLWVLLVADARGSLNVASDPILAFASNRDPRVVLGAKELNASKHDPRIFSSSSSSSSGTNLFTNSALELSLGAFNSLFGSSDSSSTVSIGNLSYLTLGALILVPLIIGLALVFYLIGGSGAVLGNALTSVRRTDDEFDARKLSLQSFNPYKIDWEKFSILEWISVAEDTWRKFDPGNLECQKRLICELHQNTYRLGYVAQKLVDAFSYLEYAEVLKLPEELKFMIDDYLDAADRGRSLKKDCGEIYSSCDFSVKKLVERVTDNEI